MKNEKFDKVLVIGLDGVPLKLMNKWKDQLPTIKSLMQLYGNLESVTPPISPIAWTSLFTGVNPGKHNLYDFFKTNDYKKEIASSKDVKSKAIWDYLTKKKLRSILINVPYTYPIKPISGIVIAGGPTSKSFENFIYPSKMKDKILKKIPKYRIGVNWQTINNNDDDFLEELYEVTEYQKKVCLLLMKEKWDFFMVVFNDLDSLFHFHWRYMDKDHPFHNINKEETKKYENSILNYLKFLDKCILELVKKIDKKTLILLVSDHGFGPVSKQVGINNYLEKFGFLKRKEEYAKKQGKLEKILPFLYKLGLYKIFKKLPENIQKLFRDKLNSEKVQDEEVIDWKKTYAWFNSLSNHSIRINLKEREKEGIVNKSELNKLRNKIILKLIGIKDNGKRVIKKVYKPEEIYFGRYLENAPDLVIELEEGYVPKRGFSEKFIEESKQGRVFKSGDHLKMGFFAIHGEGIIKGKKDANIMDIAPTILANFGIKNKCDGKRII